MRHRVKGYKLGRTASHRRATLRALATALIRNKKIKTTVAKAKATRMFVEPLITRAKNDTVHNRRIVAAEIHDKAAVKELFEEIAERVAERNGGYTRVIRLGQRPGDGAEMAILELVDYNLGEEVKTKKSHKKEEPKEETKAEDVKEEATEETTKEVAAETSEEKEEEAKTDEAEVVEENAVENSDEEAKEDSAETKEEEKKEDKE